jgi:hypothetical protein
MNVSLTNWILALVSAAFVLLLSVFIPRRLVLLAPICGPAVSPLIFWAYQYLNVPSNDSVGTRGWIIIFVLAGLGRSYLVAAPIATVSLLVRLRLRRLPNMSRTA